MIFLSHNSKDKAVVEQIAETLKHVYGADKVFYDKWSIQPGDSVIQRMDDGLRECQYFIFFISTNSLNSKMVELEWQAALIKKAKDNIKFIPVRIDKSLVPQVIAQLLYIDLFSQGVEVATRQIIDVINGQSIYTVTNTQFHNIVGYINQADKKVVVKFKTEYFMEPHSEYLILMDNENKDFRWQVMCKGVCSGRFDENRQVLNGAKKSNTLMVRYAEATSPGFPFVVELTQISDQQIKVLGLMHATSNTEYTAVPMKVENEK